MSRVASKIFPVDNTFDLVILASQRAKELFYGAEKKIDNENDSPILSALDEIENLSISLDELRYRASLEIRAKKSLEDVTFINAKNIEVQDQIAEIENEDKDGKKFNESIIKDDIFGMHEIEIDD